MAAPFLRDQYVVQEWCYAAGDLATVVAILIASAVLYRIARSNTKEHDSIMDVAESGVPFMFSLVVIFIAAVYIPEAVGHVIHALTPELSMLQEAM